MNAGDELLRYLAAVLLPRVPLLLVYAVGVVLAVVYWRTHRAVAVLAAGGCGVLAATTLTFPVVQWYVMQQRQGGWGNAEVGVWLSAIGFASGLASALGTGLLVAAAFVSRRRATYPPE